MNIVRSLVKFVTDAKPVLRLAELEDGRAAAEGVVRMDENGGLVSPVNGRPCVAFYYKSFHFTGSRSGQMIPHKLKTEEVYSPFTLELEDGKLAAVPRKSSNFSAADHKALSGMGYNGFFAREDLVPAGTRVKLWGKVHRTEEGVVLTYNRLEVVGISAVSGSDQSKHKKKKKHSKKK